MSAGASAEHVARLCQLKTWPNFAGYGFNLHADRATPGQYVGKVDDGSPAEAAGLRLNDRIVEVNGCSVDGKSHAEVVSAIKSVVGQVRLLVVDAAADEFYRENGVEISASLADIEHIVCPDDKPHLTAGPPRLTYYFHLHVPPPRLSVGTCISDDTRKQCSVVVQLTLVSCCG